MAGEWSDTTLGGFVTLQRGHDLTDADRSPGTIPVMGSAGQNGFHNKALAKGPGIVVGRSGASFGQVHYCETDYWPHNTALYVTDFRGNDPRFAYYFLKALDFSRYNSGSAQASLNRNFIYPIEVRVPPLEEQRAIAHVLGPLDDKIELNRRMNETLEAMARALFKSWFVDFDPVRAKADGRESGLPKSLANIFPARLVDSELGEIPEGWCARPLGEVLKETNERAGNTAAAEYSSTNEGLQLRSERFTKQLAQSNTNNKLVRNGYLVFGLSRRVLNFGLMRDEIGSVSAAYRVFAIDRKAIEPDFLERMMRIRSNYFYNAVSASSREGQSVSSDSLGHLRFVQPSTAVQQAYYQISAGLRARQENLQAEASTVSALRDTLLPKLISGELRVKDAAVRGQRMPDQHRLA